MTASDTFHQANEEQSGFINDAWRCMSWATERHETRASPSAQSRSWRGPSQS